jgi:hypothetical protein
MENIAKFLEGCEKLGCPKHDLFQTIDLYENKNPGQVVDAIFSLSRHAAKAGVNIPVSEKAKNTNFKAMLMC